jgi:hypothetical protein
MPRTKPLFIAQKTVKMAGQDFKIEVLYKPD